MILQNTQIPIEELPKASEVHFRQLDPAYLRVDYIGNFLWFGFLFVIGTIVIFANGWGTQWFVFLAYGLWALWMGLSLFLVARNYKITGYAIRQRDLVHRTGVVFRNLTTIPFNRIQHVEITEGPIEKMFNLASIKVFTAGGSSSDLNISGLKKEDAVLIKEFITKKAGSSDEEE